MLTVVVLLLVMIAGVALLVLGFLSMPATRSKANIGYLEQLDEAEIVEDFQTILARPIHERMLMWMQHRLGQASKPKTGSGGGGYRRNVARELALAGLDGVVIPEMIMVVQIGAGLVAVGVMVVVMVFATGASMSSWFVAMVLALIAGLAPRFLIRRAGAERSRSIARDLPDVMELAAMGVRAGQSVDTALGSVIDDFPGPLSDELRRMIDDVTLGTPRRQAMVALKERTDVHLLGQLMTTLIQADEMGIPIATIMRNTAADARQRRHQEAQEAAAKLPVKMLLPLVFCIFPAVLVIIAGPAVSSIRSVLG